MIFNCVLLILGFVLLIKGSDVFVDASVGIANKLNVPKIIIGLTIVAMGSSAPEFVISVTASARGSNALAIGNIVGSNIFNLMFIIGLCAMIKPMPVNFREIHKDFLLSIAAAVLLLALKIFGGDYIPRAGSFLLVAIFAMYMFFVIRKGIQNAENAPASSLEDEKKSRPLPIVILLALFGLAMIISGGHLTVESATFIATEMNVSERIIAITIIAVGTSLPELVICLVACKKCENEFALGNVIGSSIFNILLVLGVSGLIRPLQIDAGLISDTIFLIAGSVLAIIFVYTKRKISRREGLIMTALYLMYMYVAVSGMTSV
jgi:cation:H+ antiporter